MYYRKTVDLLPKYRWMGYFIVGMRNIWVFDSHKEIRVAKKNCYGNVIELGVKNKLKI